MTESRAPERRLLAERYRLDRVIGHGGMGWVWAAHDEMLGRDVAVKEVVPPPDLTEEQRDLIRQRTLREARAAARVSHPSAVTVFDVVEDDGRPYIVMQLLPPHTLADALAQGGPLPPDRVARIGLDLVDALDAAHRVGVLHRDVKPGNVLLAPDGRAVLTDFGIAHVEDDPTLTATGMLVGSPAYMPPERARGEAPTPASDLWSLGATLFAAVEGQPPFRRDGQLPTLNAVLNEPVPPAVHAGPLRPVLDALLTRDPAQRPNAARTRELILPALAPVPVGVPDADEQRTAPVDVAPTVEALPGPPPPPVTAPAPRPTAPSTPTGPTAPTEPSPPPVSRPVPAASVDARTSAAPVAPPSVTPRDGRRRRTALVAAVAALVLLPAGAAAVHIVQDDGGATGAAAPPRTPATTPAASASATAGATSSSSAPAPSDSQPSQGSSQGSSKGSGGSSSGRGTGSSGRSVPAGFRRYTDPTGFSLAVPDGWQASRGSSGVTFRRPGSRAYLLVPQTTSPKPDSLVDWQQQERAASPRFPGYQRIRLERVPASHGWDVADWEFRWTPSGGTLHVLDRNLRINDRRAYALYWSVPEGQWAQLKPSFQVIYDSFRPAT